MKSLLMALTLVLGLHAQASATTSFYCRGSNQGRVPVEVFYDRGSLAVSDVFIYDVMITEQYEDGPLLTIVGQTSSAFNPSTKFPVRLEVDRETNKAMLLMMGGPEELSCRF
jgi:hypothetical protein